MLLPEFFLVPGFQKLSLHRFSGLVLANVVDLFIQTVFAISFRFEIFTFCA